MAIESFNFVELNSSCSGQIGSQNEMRREFLISWTDLGPFLRALRGGWQSINSVTRQYLPPDRCVMPEFGNFWCTDAAFTPYGVPTYDPVLKVSTWDQCKITGTYKIPKYDPSSGAAADLVEEDLDFSIEELTLLPGTMKDGTGSGAKSIDQPLRVLLPLCSYTLTLPGVPSLPGGNAMGILSLLGLVNATSFRGADPYKMLFLGARTSRSVSNALFGSGATGSTGSQAWKLEYKFLYRPIKWTETYVNSAGMLTLVEPVDSGGNRLYEAGSFNSLFK